MCAKLCAFVDADVGNVVIIFPRFWVLEEGEGAMAKFKRRRFEWQWMRDITG